MDNVDKRLVELCRRDEIIAVRDEARRAAEQGDEQAGYVLAWMEQVITTLSGSEGGASRTAVGHYRHVNAHLQP